tara:strand:- start:925 stop:1743 length:819 start_codon:yes stop_codon:yes gene_type:complete
MSVFVIGEMASAHDGDIGKAKSLIDVAVKAGCNAVKVQFWSSADRLADRRRVPQKYRDIYKRYMIPVEWLWILRDYCGDRIEFMATCFLPEDVEVVSPHVNRFKVSAFEDNACDLLRESFDWADERQVIVSVNSDTLNEYLFSNIGAHDALLYCVTSYPAPLTSINLHSIMWIGVQFTKSNRTSPRLGFSDHTGHLYAGAFSVCSGAGIVEVHMKLDSTDPDNPDGGSFAHLPQALKKYVSNIREAESLLNVNAGRNLSSGEIAMMQYKVKT